MSTKSAIIQSLELPQNYTDLLLALCTADSTAADLLQRTKVSNGRIYKILSELETLGLVTKTLTSTSKQATYSISPFTDHIQSYLQHQFRDQSQKTASIIKSLDSLDRTDSVEVIHGTKADFDHHIENFLYQASWVKILHKHTSLPWFLYCFDEDIFFKFRHILSHTRHTGSSSLRSELLLKRQAYLDAYATKPVEHIMSRQSYLQYQAILKKNHLLVDLPSQLKKYPGIKIYLIDKLHNPFSTYVSESSVIQPLFFPSHTDRLLLLSGPEISATYTDYFGKYLEDAKPLGPLDK